MTIFVASNGKRVTVREIVTTSTSVDLMTVSDKSFLYTVESVSVRLKGSDTSFDFSIDGGADGNVSFAGADAFGSATYWYITDHHPTIEHGKTLKFKAGGSTSMHVTAVLIQSESNAQGRQ